jgi:Spy/CpxP family protein refolding chaperone
MHSNRVIALVVATLVSTAGFAGAQGTGSARAARAQGKGAVQRGGPNGLMRGVTLSEAEKAKVKEIQARYRTEAKSLRESMQPAMAEARAARQKGDTAAVRAVLERTKSDREKAREMRTRQLADLRAALSPENQTAFDATVKQAKAKVGERGRKVRGPARKVGRARPNT